MITVFSNRFSRVELARSPLIDQVHDTWPELRTGGAVVVMQESDFRTIVDEYLAGRPSIPLGDFLRVKVPPRVKPVPPRPYGFADLLRDLVRLLPI